jgi:hypothetical protein
LRARSLLALAALGCGGAGAKAPVVETPLSLSPVVDLAPAAAVVTLVVARPKELYADATMLPALGLALPDDEVASFASRHGGVDPRQLDEIVVGTYPHATLVLAHGVVDPARVEASFAQHSLGIDGRAIDHAGGPLTTITRAWGDVPNGAGPTEHEQMVTFGHEALALEIDDQAPVDGKPMVGPARAAELFALRKLAKAKPALAAPPLTSAAKVLGDAPIRVLFPGPFEGQWATALGGLLRAATAVGVAATPDGAGSLRIRVAVLGGFGDKGPQAAEKLGAAVDMVASSSLGRLAGLDHPTGAFHAEGTAESATLEGRVDALAMARGIRAATSAQISEMMKY